MVAATDYAPTILDQLGLAEPGDMDGHVMEVEEGDADDVQSLVDRLAHVKSRRGPGARGQPRACGCSCCSSCRSSAARARACASGSLTAMWLPGVALVTGAIDPSRTAEAAILAAGSLLLAFVTDALVRWPRAPAVPAAAVLLAHAVDLAFGSPLIVRSLAGPNPGFGARFFGIGNELEAILAVMVLLGAGALLVGVARARRPLLVRRSSASTPRSSSARAGSVRTSAA